jgi:pilus assembly protein CpaC
MLSGTAASAEAVDRAIQTARQFVPSDDPVINSVEIMQAQQVMLEVRFIEASRTIGRDLGVQWNIFGSHVAGSIGSRKDANQLPLTAPTSPTSIPVGETAAGVLSGGSPFGFLLGRMISGGTTVDAAINALEQRGLVRNLAEPNLVALSGDTASFLAGGEFPIPVATNLGQITIDWKRYGVGLAFTPTVLKQGLINLKIEPEVSQLDPNVSVPIGNGLSVPALIVRRAATTLELRDGQSFMMGGLLLNVSTNNQEQLPWLGDVPVLGALFRSASYQKKETDLAIIVTPHLVRPARPTDPIKTPLDNTVPANDPDFFLMGKSELTPTDLRLALGHQKPFVGHILDLPKGGANVVTVKN